MAVGRSRSDDEDIGHHEEIRDVEKGNVVALLVQDCVGSGPRCGFGVRSGWDRGSFSLCMEILGVTGREATRRIAAVREDDCRTAARLARFHVEPVFGHIIEDGVGHEETNRTSF